MPLCSGSTTIWGISDLITDFTEYHREYYHKRRKKIIDYLGGRCVDCGATDDLHIDHVDPQGKSFEINSNLTLSNPAVRDELSKCQLLCRTHHHLKTARENTGFTHGTINAFMHKKCRCNVCKPVWRAWNDKRNAARRKDGGYGPRPRVSNSGELGKQAKPS